MPGLLPRRLRLGCSTLALLAGLAAFGTMVEPARADSIKIVGMRPVRVDSSGAAVGGSGGGGGNGGAGGGGTSSIYRALNRASSAGQRLSCGAPLCGMRLNKIVDGATSPVIDATRKLMTIEQQKSKAVIDWDQFDIDGGETVRFDQKGNADWAVLNRIGSNDPSRINGALKADGHVYLINRNGVVFGKGAQVNVRNLVASSLQISEDQFRRGILAPRTTTQPTPAFTSDGDGEPGMIRVERGARIEGPDNSSVMLLGGSVINEGTISAPAGQVVIGAGRQVYVHAAGGLPGSVAIPPTDEQYPRGVAIEVDSLSDRSDSANLVLNTGTIQTPRGGNISITGLRIHQNGLLSATTTVRAGGSIQLKANTDPQFDPSNGNVISRNGVGDMTFGLGSQTTILPENSADTITDNEQFERSKVQVIAGNVTLEQSARILAPAGDVSFKMATVPATNSGGRFYMDRFSRIDVSGTTSTEVAMERNQIAITLRDNELNSPLQRGGFLFGKTINVDVREGSPIGNIDGYLKGIGRTATERSAIGGDVSITHAGTDGDVVIRDNATIDVSGGQVRYRDGWLDTTQLVGRNGKVYDISDATPDIEYVAFAEDRYASQQVYGRRFEAGYVDGMDAGSVSITTSYAAIDGRVVGQTTPGVRQRSKDALPRLGALNLVFNAPTNVSFGAGGPRLPAGFGADSPLPEGMRDLVVLDPSLIGSGGVDTFRLQTLGGDIAVPRGVALRTAAGGTVDLRSGRDGVVASGIYLSPGALETFGKITVAGTIEAPSGTITLGGREVRLAAGARLLARGQWVNDSIIAPGRPAPAGPALPDGGSITIAALTRLETEAGSVIDVSAGGWAAPDGGLVKGKGGSVDLASSRYLSASPDVASIFAVRPSQGRMALGGDIRGFGLDRGGTLTIRTDRIQIGGASGGQGTLLLDPGFLSRGGFSDVTLQGYRGVTVAAGAVVEPAAATLLLNPGYLGQASGSDVFGFGRLELLREDLRPAGSLTLIARGSVLTADDYGFGGIIPVAPGAPGEDQPAEGGGSVVFGRGSVVRMGQGGAVTAIAARTVRVDGTIEVPAGQITLTGGVTADQLVDPSGSIGAVYNPEAGVRIGATGRLLARGAIRLNVTSDGTRRGTVLDGGTIALRTHNGSVILERGSVLDVSGVSTEFDIRALTMYGLRLRRQTVAGDAGTIRLTASEGLFVDGTLLGRAGGPGAAGGTLITEMLQRGQISNNRPGLPFDFLRVLNVRQSGLSDAAASGYDADTLRELMGQGFVRADEAMDGGFGTWVMGSENVVNFDGDVSIHLDREIQIAAPTISATSGSSVTLKAPHVALENIGDFEFKGNAQAFRPQLTGPATLLSILADLIDINGGTFRLGADYRFDTGELDPDFNPIYAHRVFGGFDSVRFESKGDIRFTGIYGANAGTLDSAGDLTFKAAQLYPTTDQDFTISAAGTVRIEPNGPSKAPLSVGGKLTIAAPEVVQNGTIRAPLGKITLGMDADPENPDLHRTVTLGPGSLTTVALDQLVPYGYVQNGTIWFPSGTASAISQPPVKEVRLRGDQVDVQDGAVIDVRGGGDLLAAEFIPGLGGPADILGDPNSFAVIPDFDGYAPIDQYLTGLQRIIQPTGDDQAIHLRDLPVDTTADALSDYLRQGASTSLRVGDRVYLSGGSGLPAGTYILLPARYALMPGAYRVRAFDGRVDQLPKSNGPLPDGSRVVAGRRSVQGTTIVDARWSGFQVESSEVIRARAQYDEYRANTFFRSDAFLKRQQADRGTAVVPVLPLDGGTLVANATETLRLDGTGRFEAAEGGRLGRFDVASAKIAVVASAADEQALADDGYLLLEAGQLNDFGIGSLMIGGERSAATVSAADPRGGTQVSVSASSVIVRNDAEHPLEVAEVLLVAGGTDPATGQPASVTVESGSVIRTGTADAGPADTLRFGLGGSAGDGALLRLSAGDRVDVVRENRQQTGGTLTIEEGATLEASGSLALDASGDTILRSDRITAGRALDAAAGQISFGDAPDGTPGLVFRDGALGVLAQAETLTLRSYGTMDFYGNVDIGLDRPIGTLSLDSGALVGHGGDTTIRAGSVRLRNTGNALDGALGDQGGSLRIEAVTLRGTDGRPVDGSGRIVLADGPARIAGFTGAAGVTLSADERIVGTSGLDTDDTAITPPTDARPARLRTDGTLFLSAAALSAGAGSDNRIEAGGGLSFTGIAVPDLPGFDEVGGRLRLAGQSILLNGRVETRAGILEATAAGALTIAGGTVIDAAGTAQTFFDQTRFTPGGVVKLTSTGGTVDLQSGSRIALGGARATIDGQEHGGDAGRLIVDAAKGQFLANGTIEATAVDGSRQGVVDLDVRALDGSFDTLAGKLAAAGFAEAQRLRIRTGDVALSAGQTITAREFALSADGGNLTIGGTINASGATGGDIRLAAGQTLTLAGGAVLNASGAAADAAGKGGSVLLAAGDDGRLDLQSDSAISVGAGGATGSVHLRAPRTEGGKNVAITQLGSGIDGARQIVVEAYKFYDVTTVDGSLIQDDLTEFAENNLAGKIAERFGTGVTARAGVELRSAGDLTLGADLDLHALQNPDGTKAAPGILTLRAGGNLTFLGHLSDGFTTVDGAELAGGDSWSYRLVGGADLSGADPLALLSAADLAADKGDVVVDTLAANRPLHIRTGTGDIDIAAARDFVLGAKSDMNVLDPNAFPVTFIPQAVVYTAGQPITGLPEDLLDKDIYPNAIFPTGGGDIGIRARRGLYGVPTTQLVSDYVWRQGDSNGNLGLATAWWIDFAGFQQGVGALAGGNVSLRSDGEIRNLSAVIPTVGWVSGTDSGRVVNIRNGGSLTIDALGDIVSGVYYVGRGDATIESGGSIMGGASMPLVDASGFPSGNTIAPRTILAVGDAPFRLRARGDLTIETAVDPMLLPPSARQSDTSESRTGGFLSRGANGAVSLESVGGDVRFGNDGLTVGFMVQPGRYPFDGPGPADAAMVLYPSTVRATSFSGDIAIDFGMVLATADRGTLEFLAADDVLFRPQGITAELRQGSSLGGLWMADVDASSDPTPLNPVSTIFDAGAVGEESQFLLSNFLVAGVVPDQAGRHAGDRDPALIYAVSGNIQSGDLFSVGRLIVPKSLRLQAGTDIRDLSVNATNIGPDDISIVRAGRDIDLAFGSNNATARAGVMVGGPGQLQVSAGRDIDLGAGFGILTDGNLRTPSLPERGADITVLAGVGADRTDRAAFYARYLDPAHYGELQDYLLDGASSIYTDDMIAYVEGLTGRTGLDAATAWALFQGLAPDRQEVLVRDIFYAELRASGREAGDPSSPRFGATDRGYAAIDVMFPGDAYSGGISMRDSQIKTQRGGNISILAPGGSVQLGAPTPEASLDPKAPNDSGLWTVLGGDIRVFADDDILIRTSRALTARGGDILMWSSFGDIDAGLGSRTAISTAPAIVRLTPTGTLRFEPGGIVSGSGIGALQPPGDVDLYAPNGIVDAGEGGIRVAGNFNVFAVQVLNADNIQVGGQAVGLPTAPVNPASISGVSDVAAQATRAIEQSVRDQAERNAKPNDEAPPLLITGSFLGYEGS